MHLYNRMRRKRRRIRRRRKRRIRLSNEFRNEIFTIIKKKRQINKKRLTNEIERQ